MPKPKWKCAVEISGLFGIRRERADGGTDVSVGVSDGRGHEFFMFASVRDRGALHFEAGDPVLVKGVLLPDRRGSGYVVMADSIESFSEGSERPEYDLFSRQTFPDFPSEDDMPTSFYDGETDDELITELIAAQAAEDPSQGGEALGRGVRPSEESVEGTACGDEFRDDADARDGKPASREGSGEEECRTGHSVDSDAPHLIPGGETESEPSGPGSAFADGDSRQVGHDQNSDLAREAARLHGGIPPWSDEGGSDGCLSLDESGSIAFKEDPSMTDPVRVMDTQTWITVRPPRMMSTRTEFIGGKRYRCAVFNPYDRRLGALLIGERPTVVKASEHREVIHVKDGPTILID